MLLGVLRERVRVPIYHAPRYVSAVIKAIEKGGGRNQRDREAATRPEKEQGQETSNLEREIESLGVAAFIGNGGQRMETRRANTHAHTHNKQQNQKEMQKKNEAKQRCAAMQARGGKERS